MIRFLGSFRFAILLIALSLLAVMAGTFLEAKTQSHGWAEAFVYHNPLFQLLLCGYFVNILLSALLRWPFRIKHIPFLITHLGLLMLIGGVFIKSVYGTQGHLQLIEGTASDELILPHTPALHITRSHTHESIPIHNMVAPHAEEKWTGWIQDGFFILKGYPPLPLITQKIQVGLEKPLNIYFKEPSVLEDPYLLVEQNAHEIVLKTRGFEKTFSSQRIDEWVAYDKGFSGYALQAEIPFASKDMDELTKNLQEAKNLSPPLELIRISSEKTGLDFAKTTLKYLKKWGEEGDWLFDLPFPIPLAWEMVPQSTQNALFWIASLLDEDRFMEKLQEIKWPLIEPLEKIKNKELLYSTWMIQLLAIQDELPQAPAISPVISAKMLTAYLRLYDIHWNILPDKVNYITLESPLYRSIEQKPPPIKKEDASPLALVEFEGKTIPLVYDSTSSRLKIPVKNALLRFQPHRIQLPHMVRLHSAEDIKYPGSDQTSSFECTLTLHNKATGEIQPCHLSMNNVFETNDGYRFYLSGMGQVDSLGVRTVQLVVNRDPAKWMLTYPGAALVSCGILLLFWLMPGNKKNMK